MSLLENTGLLELSRWANYEFMPSPVIGFHGCDQSVGEAILRGETTHLELSRNDYAGLVRAFISGKEIHCARDAATSGALSFQVSSN